MLNSRSKTNRINLGRLFALALGVTAIGAALLPDHSRSSAAPAQPEQRNVRVRTRNAEEQLEYAGSSRMMSPMMFAAITVDRTDDTAAASACTAAANDCSLRGAVAFANSNTGTTINVPAGTYNLTISGAGEGFSGNNSIGDLDITGDNTSIVGAGAAVTVITQTTAGSRVIEVNPFIVANFAASISGVTISGGTETTGVGGGGILSGALNNNMTVSNSVISGNSATGAGTFGGGGICHTGGNLTITGTTFSNNSTSASGGGVSYSAGDPAGSNGATGTLTVSGSTFTGNTGNSFSAGGGALNLFDFNVSASVYNVDSSSFSGNSAPNRSGGAIIVQSGGPLTVTTSSFATNSAGNSGGAIFSNGTSASVTYSRLVGNSAPSGSAIFQGAGAFTANDDWWGINTGPAPGVFASPTGNISPASYLQLRASGSPNSICVGATSTVTADITQRNIGSPLTTELIGLPSFPAMIINATPAVGNLSGVSTSFVNGGASATFTATASGTANIDAAADNQIVTASIEVATTTSASDPPDQAVCQGALANFSTSASGSGLHYAWTLDGNPYNGDSSSISIDTTSLSVGNHTVAVMVTGTCGSASQSATLTVQANTTTTDPVDQSVCEGATANFSTTASGTGPFTFVWKKGSTVLNTGDLGGRVTITNGSSSSTLTISNVQSTDAGMYSVETTGACNTATQSATLAIDSTPPTISCPSNITVESTCPSGAVVTYTTPVGIDSCPGATTTRTAGLASGSVFPIGSTTVTYTVTDSTGQSASCSFTVTVLTPQAVIQNMINAVNALQAPSGPLSGQQVQGLRSKLQAALDAINEGKINVGCNKLADFISQVSGYIQNGTLTSAQGQPLINSATHVRNTIRCSGTSGACT